MNRSRPADCLFFFTCNYFRGSLFLLIFGLVGVCLSGSIMATTLYAEDNAEKEQAESIRQMAEMIQLQQQNGQSAFALQLTKTLVKLLKPMLPGSATDLSEALVMQGQLEMALGDGEAAQKSLTEGKAVLAKALGGEHWRVLDLDLLIGELDWFASLTPEQQADLDRSLALHEQQMSLYQAGQFDEALAAGQEALAIERKLVGENHQQVAESLNTLGLMYQYQGDYTQAATLYEQATQVRAKVYGKQHPTYAESLNNQAGLYQQAGQLDEANRLFQEAFAIYEKSVEKSTPEFIQSLDNLAGSHAALTEFKQAEKLYLEAYELAQRYLSPENPLHGRLLNNLGVHYFDVGDYTRAEEFDERARKNAEEMLGSDHPEYATALNNLAKLYDHLGEYDRAIEQYQQSIDITHNYYRGTHPELLLTQNNLAQTYHKQGNYALAQQTYREVLAGRATLLGEDHPDYATTLDGLATTYLDTGRFAEALRLYQQAASIRKKTLGVMHLDYGQSLNNLAICYSAMGDFTTAETLNQQSNDVIKAVLSPAHRDYATSVANLAYWYMQIGEFEKARSMYDEALSLFEKAVGEDHPLYMNCLKETAELELETNNLALARDRLTDVIEGERKTLGEQHSSVLEAEALLATALLRMGELAESEQMMTDIVARSEASLGKSHPQTLQYYIGLAVYRHLQQKYDEAQRLAQLGLHGYQDLLQSTAGAQSERQQLAMARQHRHLLDSFLSLAVDHPQYSSAAWQEVLAQKGAILVRQRQIRQLAGNDKLAPLLAQLEQTSTRLATLSRVVPEPDQKEVWKSQVDELRRQREQVEADLSNQSAEYRTAQERVTIDEIATALPDNSVLIDYLKYSPINLQNPNDVPEYHLLAFVMRPGEEVQMFDLGEADPIDSAIDTWRESFGLSPEGSRAAVELRKFLWEPFASQLEGRDHVFVSVDAMLGRLPIIAMPGNKPGSYLLEDHRISLVPVPHMLPEMIREQNFEERSGGLLILGDVDYDRGPPANSLPSVDADQPLLALNPPTRSGSTSFAPLPATIQEIESIAQLYAETWSESDAKINQLKNVEATEQNFRDLAGSSEILHLATHGFFADPEAKTAATTLEDSEPNGKTTTWKRAPSDPGLLSGLALTGANREPIPGQDDGILTAVEISSLALDNVDLVVLSACETGLGQAAAGEGLLGIQRAFQVAGADATIASLWQVGDDATMLLMERLYRNLWEKKMSKLDALREAQLYLLNHPDDVLNRKSFRGDRRVRAKQHKEKSNRLSPEFWAAFSLSGAWE
ncbi:CHAT domain-containing tetratricopeptide repeat protein [Polystyrenella longa]|uniref:CHAT domain-containing tetratricopeptide repeat protein n=1 Tax=Polystyrenella longa TaxID=2528007 RepID=UPI0018D25179|nr:CHAT domain-containing protein [Polystyrenella longa]